MDSQDVGFFRFKLNTFDVCPIAELEDLVLCNGE